MIRSLSIGRYPPNMHRIDRLACNASQLAASWQRELTAMAQKLDKILVPNVSQLAAYQHILFRQPMSWFDLLELFVYGFM